MFHLLRVAAGLSAARMVSVLINTRGRNSGVQGQRAKRVGAPVPALLILWVPDFLNPFKIKVGLTPVSQHV